MTGLTFQPTRAHLIAKGLNHRDQAPAVPRRQQVREISVLPFVLIAAVLFTSNLGIAAHSQGEGERAFLFAAFGAAGMPIFQWSPPRLRPSTAWCIKRPSRPFRNAFAARRGLMLRS
jgi:hypothetical protein